MATDSLQLESAGVGNAAAELHHIQPADLASDVAVDQFAGTSAARNLDRLAGDRALVDALMWRRYEGREWKLFRDALTEYGFQVILAWCLTGRIFLECRRKGFGGLRPPPRRIDRDDSYELAGETVAASLNYFRDRVLVPGLWDPTRGASLKTFFVGACLHVFANVYREWQRENSPLLDVDCESEMPLPARADPTLAWHLREVLTACDARALELINLVALGYTQDEIAELLATTPKAVERRLERLRKRIPR